MYNGTGSRAHRTIARLVEEGAALATTEVVVGELLSGVRDEIAYRRAGGVSPSLTDCLVAAPALVSGAQVLHADKHFEDIASVTDLGTYPLD